MSVFALVSGALYRAPEKRTSKSGKPFVSATMREGSGELVTWWKILAFSDSTSEELLTLADGDALAVSGSFKVELYEKNSEQRLAHTIFAERVITAHRRKAKKKEPESASTRSEAPSSSPSEGRPFDDDIPF